METNECKPNISGFKAIKKYKERTLTVADFGQSGFTETLIKRNCLLFCEAHNIANETNQTPKQLQAYLDKAVEILKRIGTGNRYTTIEINNFLIELETNKK